MAAILTFFLFCIVHCDNCTLVATVMVNDTSATKSGLYSPF